MHLSDKCDLASSASIIIGSLLRLVGEGPNPLNRGKTPELRLANLPIFDPETQSVFRVFRYNQNFTFFFIAIPYIRKVGFVSKK